MDLGIFFSYTFFLFAKGAVRWRPRRVNGHAVRRHGHVHVARAEGRVRRRVGEGLRLDALHRHDPGLGGRVASDVARPHRRIAPRVLGRKDGLALGPLVVRAIEQVLHRIIARPLGDRRKASTQG